MRFIDHENPPEPPVKPWWSYRATASIDLSTPAVESDLTALFSQQITNGVDHLAALLDDLMFWEPAREALANGGCRQ